MIDQEQDTSVPRRPHKRSGDSEMDITPMIDITFLLLIFFIVASKMDPQAAVDQPEAEHGTTVAEKSAVTIVVARGPGEEPLIYKGKSKNPDLLVQGSHEDQEAEIADYVDQGLNGSPPKTAVLIKAEKGVKFRHIDRVAKAASRSIDDQSLHVGIVERK